MHQFWTWLLTVKSERVTNIPGYVARLTRITVLLLNKLLTKHGFVAETLSTLEHCMRVGDVIMNSVEILPSSPH